MNNMKKVYHVAVEFSKEIEHDKINNLDLRSDIETNNFYGNMLVPQGYVGNRPDDSNEEFHEDDSWAIVAYNEYGIVASYLYTSEFEYNEDIKLLTQT